MQGRVFLLRAILGCVVPDYVVKAEAPGLADVDGGFTFTEDELAEAIFAVGVVEPAEVGVDIVAFFEAGDWVGEEDVIFAFS